MQKTQGAVEHPCQRRSNGCLFGLTAFPQASFRKLDVPVTELMPDERVDGIARFIETILFERMAHLDLSL